MFSMRYVVVAIVMGSMFPACATAPLESDDPIEESELTGDELAALPDEVADEHAHEEAVLVEGPAEDDAALFDDAYAVASFDEPVIDDGEAAGVAGETAALQPLLKWGLHPRASDALRAAGVAAWRITQTIGNAPASAGVHLADGGVNGKPYTAAVELSVSGMTAEQIHNLLEKLGKVGYAAWYRKSGSDGWSGVNHIHGVYANCKMKSALRSQVRSWLVGRNGLVSNTIYRWHTFTTDGTRSARGRRRR